jgi:hypothetical protein
MEWGDVVRFVCGARPIPTQITQFQSRLTFQVAVSNLTRADTSGSSGVAAVFAGPAVL